MSRKAQPAPPRISHFKMAANALATLISFIIDKLNHHTNRMVALENGLRKEI